ncbi:hypothetical protein JXB41_01025 [Candidatus Woesearchaeota archaeon]|nr:hypothetical protein [Candidatus Woesearchaeota archaeon]
MDVELNMYGTKNTGTTICNPMRTYHYRNLGTGEDGIARFIFVEYP